MSTSIKVVVVGATGRTGESVVEGLLDSDTDFEITVLTRPSSLETALISSYKERNIKVVAANLKGPKKELVQILTGIDIVVSCMHGFYLQDQLPLIEAAKEAGVKRFVPSNFSTPAPRGVMIIYDEKEDILAAIQRAHLPWTIIDVGWWSNNFIKRVPSGRTDRFVQPYQDFVAGDGTVPVAVTELRDIGKYTAKIITDPRTINKKVLAYTEVISSSQFAELQRNLMGEDSILQYLPVAQLEESIASGLEDFKVPEKREEATLGLFVNQYIYSWGVRGDSTPEAAEIFGYLDFKKLYPGLKGKTAKQLIQDILDGKQDVVRAFASK